MNYLLINIGTINWLFILKKNKYDNSGYQKNIVIIGGNEVLL